MMSKARTIPLATVREECRRIQGHLKAVQAFTAEELRELEPGGSQNPEDGARGVLRWHALLNQRFAADQARSVPSAADEAAEADALATRALAAEPIVHRLLTPVADREQVAVHPKSAAALLWFDAQDRWLAELADARRIVGASFTNADRELTARIDAEIAFTLSLFVWALCTPGPKLPFEPSEGARVEVPDWARQMDPIDIAAVCQLHVRVNALRARALTRVLDPESPTSGKANRWSVFFSMASMELGERPTKLIHDWSLVEVLGAVRLSRAAKAEAALAADRHRGRIH